MRLETEELLMKNTAPGWRRKILERAGRTKQSDQGSKSVYMESRCNFKAGIILCDRIHM